MTFAPAFDFSVRALSTPEPSVRQFARRVQQEGALDLTQGDYKNADFAPHPEVVRAAQRLTRNTVHSYGPAVGRMDVRAEVAEFFNRDGLLDYPNSDVRFFPDEVIFTPGTRGGLAMVLEVLGRDGSGVVVPRPSWEYDWFIERAGKKVVELHTSAPDFLPDPAALERLLAAGNISTVILNNPHNPTGRVYPRALVEELCRVAVKYRCYVIYDSVYQRLDYVDAFVNPVFANPEWRPWIVTLSGLSKMDMFGASTGARACWIVMADAIQANGVRAREIIANLSAWLVATPSTLAQDWALAALQSPLASLRRPSPYMRERRDFIVREAAAIASLGVEATDCGGTFYAPLAFSGLVGERFERVRNGLREVATVKSSADAFDFLLTTGVGGVPFVAFAGHEPDRYGTWQRLSYGSKDVRELAVFFARVRAGLERQGRHGSSAPAAAALADAVEHVWHSTCRATGYDALDSLDAKAFATERAKHPADASFERVRLTGTKHPDSTAHRAAQLARAEQAAGRGEEGARALLSHIEWHPYFEAHEEFHETVRDLLGPCNEVLLDFEGRNISQEWLDIPEKVVLALLHKGVVPGQDRHLLCRVPNPWIEQDEDKLLKLLTSVARANAIFLVACEKLNLTPTQNAIYEIAVPQVNALSDIGALAKIGALYLRAVANLWSDDAEHADHFLMKVVPEAARAEMRAKLGRVRLVPLVENVGALSHLPELLEAFYATLAGQHEHDGAMTAHSFVTSFTQPLAALRVFVAMSDTAEQSGKIATDAAYVLALSSRDAAERRLAALAHKAQQPAPKVTFLIGAGRAGFRGGFDPAHEGVIAQFARADGVTLQGIRADDPAGAETLAAKFRAAVAERRPLSPLNHADRELLLSAIYAGVRAHTDTLLRLAPLLAPFSGLVPQTRVRIRPTGSVNYGRSIPEYPTEWGGGTTLPDRRDLRDAWPEGVTLPRAIVFNLGLTTLGLPALSSDLAVLDKRVAVLLERTMPGYRELLSRELPYFVHDAVALLFGKRFADTVEKQCLRAAATLWADVKPNAALLPETLLFAMLYLRYLAEDSDSWDETKEHESQTTREGELIRETASGAFCALCSEQPGKRWHVLQALVEANEAPRLLLARELTIDEKREFVDLRIDGWLRGLGPSLGDPLRRAWSELREYSKAELTARAIKQLIALEHLRGDRGA